MSLGDDEKNPVPSAYRVFAFQFAMWSLAGFFSRTARSRASASAPAAGPSSSSSSSSACSVASATRDDTNSTMSGPGEGSTEEWDPKLEVNELDPSFVLKVLITGERKAGKSTVANALLRASYCEVSPIKPTGTITEYRLVPDDQVTDADRAERQRLILERNRKSNTALEDTDEPSFGAYPLRGVGLSFETRPDTQVSLVDTPAISKKFCSEHINKKGEDYDVKVFVLDVTKSNNDHDELLNLVSHARTASSASMVILANKVDQIQYPDDPTKHEDRLSALRKYIEEKLSTELLSPDEDSKLGGIYFIPLCASQASVVRIAENSTKSEPFTMSDDQMNWLLRFGIGQEQADTMSDEDKRAHACAMVCNSDLFGSHLLTGSNFGSFTGVLSKIMGDEELQVSLIRRQLVNSLNSMQPEFGVARKMEDDFLRFEVIENAWGHIRTAFWKLFDGLETKTISAFKENVNVEAIEKIVTELEEYVAYVGRLLERGVITDEDQAGEEAEASRRMLDIVVKICDIISTKAYDWEPSGAAFLAYHRSVPFRSWMPGRPTWKNISPYDWNTLIAAIDSNVSRKDFRGPLVQALQKLENAKRFGPFNQSNSAMRNDFAVMVRLSGDPKAKNYVYLVDIIAWDDVVKRMSKFLEPDTDESSSRRSSRSRANSCDISSIAGGSTSTFAISPKQVVIDISGDIEDADASPSVSLGERPNRVSCASSGCAMPGKRKRYGYVNLGSRKRFMFGAPKSPP